MKFNTLSNALPSSDFLQIHASELLVRPVAEPDELEKGYRLRLAYLNGLSNPAWLHHANTTHHRTTDLGRARWCPNCLRENNPYWRRVWNNGPAICSTHQCWLVDTCAGCARLMTWRNARLLSCICEHSLVEVVPACFTEEVVALTADVNSDDTSLAWWKRLPVLRRWRLAHFLGALQIYGLRDKPLKRASITTVELEKTLVTTGAAILFGEETTFHQLFDRIRVMPRGDISVQLIGEAFPGLLVRMRNRLSKAECEGLLPHIRSFLLARADSSIAIAWRDKSSVAAGGAKGCAQNLGVRSERIANLLSQHGISPKIRQTAKGRSMLFVGPADLRKIQNCVAATIARTSVAKLFGLSPARQDALIKAKLLRTVGTKIDGNSVVELFQRMASRATLRPETNLPDTVPISIVLRTLVPLQHTVIFFMAILDGKIAVTHFNKNFQHVGVLKVSRLDTHTVIENDKRDADAYVTIPDAALKLRLKQEVIYQLVNREFIAVIQRRIGRRAARFIRKEELDRFNLEIEALTCAAARADVCQQGALQWAKAKGLEIISGPCIDGGRQYFVRRDTQSLIFSNNN